MTDLNTLAEIAAKAGDIYRIAQTDGEGRVEERILLSGNPCQNSYSVAKAFTVAAVGVLFDRGVLRPEEKILDVLKGQLSQAPAAGWEEVTLDHLMTHRCGLPRNFLDIDLQGGAVFGRDYLAHTLAQPLLCPPGGERSYSDGAYYLVARAVEARSGMSLDNFLWETLLWPMGFSEMAFSHCPMGHAMGATGLYISSGDAVKLGGLWLKNGVFCGKRLLSEEWISLTRSRPYEMAPVGSRGAYGKGGMRGQMLLVLPHEGRAVAWHGYGHEGKEALLKALCE